MDKSGTLIGKLAKIVGVSTDTIRFYESEGILPPTRRTGAGYRLYDEDATKRLKFIKHAQGCGLTLTEIKQLLDIKMDARSCCGDVRSFAEQKKLQLDQKIVAMQAMSKTLTELIKICTLDERPTDSCPILSALEGGSKCDECHLLSPHKMR